MQRDALPDTKRHDASNRGSDEMPISPAPAIEPPHVTGGQPATGRKSNSPTRVSRRRKPFAL